MGRIPAANELYLAGLRPSYSMDASCSFYVVYPDNYKVRVRRKLDKVPLGEGAPTKALFTRNFSKLVLCNRSNALGRETLSLDIYSSLPGNPWVRRNEPLILARNAFKPWPPILTKLIRLRRQLSLPLARTLSRILTLNRRVSPFKVPYLLMARVVVTRSIILVLVSPVRHSRQGSMTKLPCSIGRRASGWMVRKLPRPLLKNPGLASMETLEVLVCLQFGMTTAGLVRGVTLFPDGECCPNLVTTFEGDVVSVRPRSPDGWGAFNRRTRKLRDIVLLRRVTLACPRVITARKTLAATTCPPAKGKESVQSG